MKLRVDLHQDTGNWEDQTPNLQARPLDRKTGSDRFSGASFREKALILSAAKTEETEVLHTLSSRVAACLDDSIIQSTADYTT